MQQYVLTLTCPDQPGIVRALADGIVGAKGTSSRAPSSPTP